MAPKRWLAVGLSLIAAAPVMAGPKAFDVSEKDFFAKVQTVVLAPCKFPSHFSTSDTLMGLADSVKWQVDSVTARTLSEHGLKVVSARESKRVYDAVVDSLGGLYDPVTGLSDTAKFAIAEQLTRARLRDLYHPQAWAFMNVYEALAPFDHAVARWDGTTENLSQQSFGRGLFKALTLRSADDEYSGKVGVLSLDVRIEDDAGSSLYRWSGGIHATSRFNEGKFQALPQDRYFADRTRVDGSVTLALKAFTKAAEKRQRKAPSPP